MRSNPSIPIAESSGISECLDRLAAHKHTARPLSTYRLQFNAGFRFEDGRKLAGYLHALGVSHIYSSPILKARPGSMHGYDITDHHELNPDIGGYEDLQALAHELKNYGIGQILDVVPNHMGVGLGLNPWWWDVLSNGRASEFAEFFDIDWNPLKPELHNKVLLPFLGGQYGAELEAGHIQLVLGDHDFHIEYYDKHLPIDPQTIPLIFDPIADELRHPELRNVLSGLRHLPAHSTTDGELVRQRRRAIAPLTSELQKLMHEAPEIAQRTARALERINGRHGDPHSFDALHRLLEKQVYRLAHWRVSGDEINYRRFFDINDLIGLRMENPRVFAATHPLLRRLLAEDIIQGVRIDHADGLLNPRQYLVRMQMLYAASQCVGAVPKPPLAENGIEAEVQQVFGQHDWMNHHAPLYVVVEKILEPGEELPEQWPVDGSSGYDFTTLVNGLFVDGRNERALTSLYHRFIGRSLNVDDLIYNSKKLIMHASLASEVNVLAHILDEISLTDRNARDFTRKALRDVIRETIACFPVYRTYIDERGQMTDRDLGYINEAIVRAKRRNPDKAPAGFDFLRDILLLKSRNSEEAEIHRKKLYFTLKFQQLTGPVMAKGLEDTACYVDNRFISVNEVGGSPKQFDVTEEEFHRANLNRAEHWPFSMLATSTHDTKRSEDVRARLNVLSEMPKLWSSQVFRWRKANRTRKRMMPDGRAVPDLNEEYLLYQTLAGTWPMPRAQEAPQSDYIDRIQQYMTKAVHEAKVNLSWINDDPAYVEALQAFIEKILTPGTHGRPNTFLDQMNAFVPPVAFFGAMNSLAQRLLMITAPGNPDIYQGMELWEFSLVDPDNRRPVDYEIRQRLLSDLDRRAEAGDLPGLCSHLLDHYSDGRIKMWTTMQALRFRRDRAELFHLGKYVPLHAFGPKREHAVSFARENHRQIAIIVVPRLSYSLTGGALCPPLGQFWQETEIPVPSRAPETLENVFTGEKIQVTPQRTLLCREVFGRFPVALLAGG